MTPLGALPARFRRTRVLIVGCGDVGQRLAKAWSRSGSPRVLALTSSPQRVPALRALGITPLVGNLDDPRSVQRLAGLAHRVLHLAPPLALPESVGVLAQQDLRTRLLQRVLRKRSLPAVCVYISTTGVYGDCKGERVVESRPLRPQTPRALRRVDAEQQMRALGGSGVRVSVLRVPGIYAPDRPGGGPRERLLKRLPVLHADEDVYTNHIHANDLARACARALWLGKPQRSIHLCDDTDLKMGDYFDAAADALGLPRPPRMHKAQAQQWLSPMQWSFMGESRRLDNTRMKRELRLRLDAPHVVQGLKGVPIGQSLV